MAKRDTQARIVEAALELFNDHGTAAVSLSRLADHCAISKSHLRYHFHSQAEIIRCVYERVLAEMNAGWYSDHLAPTLGHMAQMFVRQLELITRYRFFYRELPHLLRADVTLRKRYADNRERRLQSVEEFFRSLAVRGLMTLPEDEQRLRSIADVTWIISESWLNHIESQGITLSIESMVAGYTAILEVLRPYLNGDPVEITRESDQAIRTIELKSRCTTLEPLPKLGGWNRVSPV